MDSQNKFAPYEKQFTIQERKELVSEMIRELRKAKKMQQKEVAELLEISPQTFNGYETGRNEPPIEILVRLSYLYGVPLDIIVQSTRFSKKDESLLLTVSKMDEEILKIREDFKQSEFSENPQLNQLIDMMKNMTDSMKDFVSKKEDK